MKILFLLLVLSLSFILVDGFTVFDDLKSLPKNNLTWTKMLFKEDHSNRQPNQPSYEWTNITFNIPDYATSVQFTANNNNNNNHKYIITEEVPYYTVNEWSRKICVSFTWYGKPWTLYIGWGININESDPPNRKMI